MRYTKSNKRVAAIRNVSDTDETFAQKQLECNQYNRLADLEDILDKYNLGLPCNLDAILQTYYENIERYREYEQMFASLNFYPPTLFQALRNGIYVKHKRKIIFISGSLIRFGYNAGNRPCIETTCPTFEPPVPSNNFILYLSDYNKTWSLRKEDLL